MNSCVPFLMVSLSISLLHGAALALSLPPRVVPCFASDAFADILDQRSVTATTFSATPLAGLSSTKRAAVLAALARGIDQQRHPAAAFLRPGIGARHDGSKRPRSQAGYHYRRNGVRVACRSGQLRWDARRWVLSFARVHRRLGDAEAPFDELQLAAYTPRGVFIGTHDPASSVSSRAHEITFCGPTHERDVDAALETLLPKLAASCGGRMSNVSFGDPRMVASIEDVVQPTPTSVAFEGVPLATCSAAMRGALLQAMARRVDETLHPRARFFEPSVGTRVNGARRGQPQATHSWRRDLARVACKSAQLCWDRRTRRWSLQFDDVRLQRTGEPAHFEELWLAAYTPRGVYLYRHDLRHGVTTRGKRVSGVTKVVGPMGVAGWAEALDEMLLPKLDASCEPLAFVRWPQREVDPLRGVPADRLDFWSLI